MNEEEKFLRKRFEELASRSSAEYRYLFTDFLTLAEQTLLLSMGISSRSIGFFGGWPGAERKMARFGSPEDFGYEEEYPVAVLKISPKMEKFADELSHRDFLGAVLNLGIDRKVLGDILVDGKSACLLCTEEIADFICENLEQVKHTRVVCSRQQEIPRDLYPKTVREEHQVSSERLDAVAAKVFNLSRNGSLELVRGGKLSVNGRQQDDPSGLLKEGDVVSARGYGRFRYLGPVRTTRKGKIAAAVERYV